MVAAGRASQQRQLGLTPRAAQGPWPWRQHRTVAQVWADEASLETPAAFQDTRVKPDPVAPASEKIQHGATLAEIRGRIDGAIEAKRLRQAEDERKMLLPVLSAVLLPPAPSAALLPKLEGALAGVQAGHRIERIARRAVRCEPDKIEDGIVSAVADLAGTGQPPSTNAARTGYTPQLREQRPVGAVAKPDGDMGRAAHVVGRPAGSPSSVSAADDEEFAAELAARLAAKRIERAQSGSGPVKTGAVNDWGRVAAAYAKKAVPPALAEKPLKPLEPAMSREECPRCGIPGWRGCAHQTAFAEDYAGHPAQRAQSGARHKTD